LSAKRILITLALTLAVTGQCMALVVVDEPFDAYPEGSYLPGQGGWTGPFYQYTDDPPDTQGPMAVNAPSPSDGRRARWQCMPGSNVHWVVVKYPFPGQWASGLVVMYIDVGMDATNGPGNFSYFQLFDSLGVEALRIALERNSGVTGRIYVQGKHDPSTTVAWEPSVITDPANGVMYKLKLEIDVTNRPLGTLRWRQSDTRRRARRQRHLLLLQQYSSRTGKNALADVPPRQRVHRPRLRAVR